MTLRTRLILVVCLALIVVTGVLGGIYQTSKDLADQRFRELKLDSASVLWRKIVESQLDSMEASMSSLTRDRGTTKLLRKGKYDDLHEPLVGLYNRLSTSAVITSLQLTDKNGNIVYNSDKSDRSSSELARKALAEGKIQRGLEIDSTGNIQLRLAFQLFYRGKPVGVGIFVRTLEGAINDLSNNDNSEISILNVSGKELLSTTPGWIDSLREQNTAELKAAVNVIEKQDKAYTLLFVPLLTNSGETLGYLAKANDYSESFRHQRDADRQGLIIAASVLLVVIFSLIFYLNHSFKPVFNVVEVLKRIADGDMNTEFKAQNRKDEFGQLINETKRMKDALQTRVGNIIDSILSSVSQLGTATQQLSEVNELTAQGAKQQDQHIHLMVDHMGSMVSSAQQVAANAGQAEEAAETANREAQQGSGIISGGITSIRELADKVSNASDVIQSLESDSNEISRVVLVISEIAEQTNLLALNAAIEAARAGEQGRGFAVVADEVRTLATRTHDSTQEIEAMIKKLQESSTKASKVMLEGREQAEHSVIQVSDAGAAFTEIAASVDTIKTMIDQIVSAANAQNSSTVSMQESVDTIKVISEEAAQGTTAAVNASADLNRLADDLKRLTQAFNL